MRWRNLIISVIEAAQRKSNRTAVVGFAEILQISHKFWSILEITVRLQKIRNGAKSRFLYRLLKTNNTPIELLWFKFGVLFRRRKRLSECPIPHDVSKKKTSPFGLVFFLARVDKKDAYEFLHISMKLSAKFTMRRI